MPRAVIILGAGASASFGVPTLAQLFKDPNARRHLAADRFLHDQLQGLFWGPRGHTLESSHLTVTVEEVLTIIRDYENYPRDIPLMPEDDREAFQRSLYVLIKKAVYDGKSSRAAHLNPLLNHARATFEHTTWASFNWDCIFESSFYYSSSNIADGRHNPSVVVPLRNWWGENPIHTFLKPHGGVNWWYDETENVVSYLPFGSQPDLDGRWAEYGRREITGYPVILEPSYYKYTDPSYEFLKPQWDRFVDDLMKADLVCMIGYSLPESDTMARTALTIGFQSGRANSRWVVVNKSEDACSRYQRLFGTVRMKTLSITLEEFNRDVPGNLADP